MKHSNNEGDRKERMNILLYRIGRSLWSVEIKRIEVPKITPKFWLRWLGRLWMSYLRDETREEDGDLISLDGSREGDEISGEIKLTQNIKAKWNN